MNLNTAAFSMTEWVQSFYVCFLFYFVPSCRYHTLKCYISNKWHGRLERSLDDILLSNNAPPRKNDRSSWCGTRTQSSVVLCCVLNCLCPFANLCCITVCDFALYVFDCITVTYVSLSRKPAEVDVL